MAEKVFVKGFRTFAKRDNAPDFVLGTLVITVDDFSDFITGEGAKYLTQYNEKDQLRIDITQGKDGRLVFAIDTWKKDNAQEDFTKPEPQRQSERPAPKIHEEIDVNDMPF
jgi:hypothetical protein